MKVSDVILVKFPFTSLETVKKRPALVIASVTHGSIRLLTIAMITSRIEGLHLPGDYVLKEWKQSRLMHPSLVRLCKMTTIDVDLVHKKLGTLSKVDIAGVREEFHNLFSSWI
ncbi:MAG: type II toxin-antitoxin system PemK/MazF family toxin [Deltaproteobacteria bacterium]|nr:type II toxin-antitoxin system PemK/MazF family toxin [Deltaproteobacteria bacterium]